MVASHSPTITSPQSTLVRYVDRYLINIHAAMMTRARGIRGNELEETDCRWPRSSPRLKSTYHNFGGVILSLQQVPETQYNRSNPAYVSFSLSGAVWRDLHLVTPTTLFFVIGCSGPMWLPEMPTYHASIPAAIMDANGLVTTLTGRTCRSSHTFRSESR